MASALGPRILVADSMGRGPDDPGFRPGLPYRKKPSITDDVPDVPVRQNVTPPSIDDLPPASPGSGGAAPGGAKLWDKPAEGEFARYKAPSVDRPGQRVGGAQSIEDLADPAWATSGTGEQEAADARVRSRIDQATNQQIADIRRNAPPSGIDRDIQGRKETAELVSLLPSGTKARERMTIDGSDAPGGTFQLGHDQNVLHGEGDNTDIDNMTIGERRAYDVKMAPIKQTQEELMRRERIHADLVKQINALPPGAASAKRAELLMELGRLHLEGTSEKPQFGPFGKAAAPGAQLPGEGAFDIPPQDETTARDNIGGNRRR